MNRNVWLLFCCQAMMNALMSGQILMASLVGNMLAADKTLITLPVAIQMLAMMLASIPASIVFARLGRKPGFWLGCLGSLAGSVTFALGIWTGSFPIYCLGAMWAGMGWGIAQHLRFAAAEVAAPGARARAISLVMTGGVLAAIVGPELVKRTNMLVPPLAFLGTYLCLAALPVLTAILLAFVQLPPAVRADAQPVPIRAILQRVNFLTAVVCSVVGYGTMSLVMSSTPLQMKLCGMGVGASADVIRAHSIAMFLPGFVTGRLIQRFGVHRIILAGAVLVLLCAAINVSGGRAYAMILAALVVLGVGWNFMFVGGTTLLTTAYSAAERMRVQAAHDFIVFGTVALAAFGSGAVEANAGWTVLNLTLLPPVAVAVTLIGWHWVGRARLAPASA